MKTTTYFAILLIASLGIFKLAISKDVNVQNPMTNMGQEMPIQQNLSIATFAGGCFWCVESEFEKLPGVKQVISGYSGGKEFNPSYKQVSAGLTSHTEAIQVYYDPEVITYEGLLQSLWRQMDPTDANGQFVDRGKQYRPAIFYHNEEQKQSAQKSILALTKAKRYEKPITIEVVPFTKFYNAEEYHQDYYTKNALRYKLYRYNSGRDQFLEEVWGADLHPDFTQYGKNTMSFSKPSDETLRDQLTPIQYEVTQKDGTERPFDNAYWDEKRAGIYVDIVSGEPLFSSEDKFDSGTGWPSFTQPITGSKLAEKTDRKFFMKRTEVRSPLGDSHLGHLFEDGPKPTGLRYCINSASLKFIPKEKLPKSKYEAYISEFKK